MDARDLGVALADALHGLSDGTEARDAEVRLPMDEDTFRAFYDRTARPVWAYLVRITGDPAAADDLLQEAYYRYFRAGVVHGSEAHRRNSLYRIATNLAVDRARRRSRAVDVPLPEEDDARALPGDRGAADRVAARTDLARAMARLAPRQRVMLWLAYAEGSSHDEIAEALGVKAGNVKSLLLRARRKLAGLLGAEARRA
jgi:RNA polymerase sigma-70 factor (ECF subfamily)